MGYAERERGHPKEAEIYLDRAKGIRERLLPPNHPEIANIYSSLAGVYVSSGKYDEGLRLFKEAVKIDLTTPYTEHKSIIFRRYLNMATAERLKGSPEAALEYVELATPYILDSFGAETHFDVTYVRFFDFGVGETDVSTGKSAIEVTLHTTCISSLKPRATTSEHVAVM